MDVQYVLDLQSLPFYLQQILVWRGSSCTKAVLADRSEYNLSGLSAADAQVLFGHSDNTVTQDWSSHVSHQQAHTQDPCSETMKICVYIAVCECLSSQPHQHFHRSLWHTKFPYLVSPKHYTPFPQKFTLREFSDPLINAWSMSSDGTTCSYMASLQWVDLKTPKSLMIITLMLENPWGIYWDDLRSICTVEPHIWL